MCSLFGLEKGDTFCLPKQLKQAPERQADKAAAGVDDALPTLLNDVKPGAMTTNLQILFSLLVVHFDIRLSKIRGYQFL